jgi:hypothetical protein
MNKISLLTVVLILSNCHSSPQPVPIQDHGTHQVVTQPGGSQVVVVKDHSGAEFFMELMMFQSLMNMAGGMNNVYNYRNQHYNDNDWNDRQRNYRTTTNTVVNNYYGTKSDPNKPISDQIKYNQSAGFSRNTNKPSNGFNNVKTAPIQTNTPKPNYNQSKGFTTPKTNYTPSKPSSGFGSTSTRSNGFGG